MLRDFWISVAALIALSMVVFWGKSYETTLRGIDSNIHAAVSINSTTPQFLPHLPIPYTAGISSQLFFNDHPFFYFWLNGIVMRVFEPTSWSARLLSAFFSIGCVLLTLALGTSLVSHTYGMLAALLFLFCRDIILTGSTVTLDMPLLFFVLLSFLLWSKKKWYWTGVAAGFGLWFKTPVVLLIYPCAFVLYLFHRKDQKEFERILISASIAIGIGSLIWIFTGLLGGWNLVTDYWSRQVWGTAVGGRNFSSDRNWFSFFSMIRRGFLPGLPLLVIGLIQIMRKRLWKLELVQLSLAAITILGCVITLMKFRFDYYYNPTFPFLAFIAAFSIKEWLELRQKWFYGGIITITPLLLAILISAPISFGEEAFVALKRFEPLIQTYGDCDTPVWVIPGGEPIGSSLDYSVHIAFYTGRKPTQVPCELLDLQIEGRSKRKKVGWLILSEENLGQCMKEVNRKRFSHSFRVGNQYLLTDIIPKSDTVNLTPLEREGRAVQDCKAPPYPLDRYHRYSSEDF